MTFIDITLNFNLQLFDLSQTILQDLSKKNKTAHLALCLLQIGMIVDDPCPFRVLEGDENQVVTWLFLKG